MVYNITYSPQDMAGAFQDLFGSFIVGLIPWVGAIIAVVLIILLIRALKK